MDLLTLSAVQRAQSALQLAVGGDSSRELARAYLRGVIARAVGDDPQEFAGLRWGRDSRAAMVVRAGVSAASREDLQTASAARAAFFEAVIEGAIIGRMTEARRVGFNAKNLVPGTNSAGYWVGEGKPIPLSRFTLTGDSLAAKKCAALVVLANETLKDPSAEEQTLTDITRAVIAALDQAFIDADNAGNDDTPAAVTYGAPAEISTGNPASDLAALVEGFHGDLDAAVLVTDPHTATLAALARDAGGAFLFPGLGPRGGSAVGIPVLTSRASPRDSSGGQWALIDQGGVAVALESLGLARSTAGTVSMTDDPEGESVLVSLFQNNLTGFLGTLHGNWKRVREGSVSVITGAAYSTSVS